MRFSRTMKDRTPVPDIGRYEHRRSRIRIWRAVELLLGFSALFYLLAMFRSWIFGSSAAVLAVSAVEAQAPSTYWTGYQEHNNNTPAWQWTGTNTTGDYWFEQTQDALAVMQNKYWNGSYWPDTIQWIGALIDTIVASTERTFTDGLEIYGGDVPGASTSSSEIQSDIAKYYEQIQAYYDNEDTIQIFGAAYDDAQWVVLEWLEVIKFLNEHSPFSSYPTLGGQSAISKYAHRAHIFYNIVQDKYNASLCEGGITWNPALATYKNAITNELLVSSSIAMYFYFPGDSDTDPYPHPNYKTQTNRTLPLLPVVKEHDPLFLLNAKETWRWMKSHNFTNEQGLIVDGFHISPNQTTCDERNEMVYSYNQAVILSGLRGLWEATGDFSYLEDGYILIDTVVKATGWNASGYADAGQWAGLGRNGILEDYCDAPANCSQDNLIFKGAYFEHLDLFCEDLPTDEALVEGISYLASEELASSHSNKCDSYGAWIQHNAQAALSTRNETGIIGQWWGASYLNTTQTPAPSYTVSKPPGSIDICNNPQLLEQWPWKCDGSHGCQQSNTYGGGLKWRRNKGSLRSRQFPAAIRTVETQAGGLSVLRAATERNYAKQQKS